ncbi:hypothetical protein TrLO_g7083 [Triparma laevis f. longispina]|uniref:ATP-grasp domain-containing protein n=1 Tax=Triparma laevis f. longispina TaxID=1714387 RepID=A0A9W7FRU4_9STRA|nr:hypothetical protein TrLO_g7083 [Triparma laevis f. longispina]
MSSIMQLASLPISCANGNEVPHAMQLTEGSVGSVSGEEGSEDGSEGGWEESSSCVQSLEVRLGSRSDARSFKFIHVNPSLPIPPQLPPNQPLHCLIHKLTEDILTSSTPTSKFRLQNLQTYCTQNSVEVIDSFESVKSLMNRSTIQEKLLKCLPTEMVPEYTVYTGEEEELEGLKFPLICKPLEAAGTRGSHRMSVVLDEKGLDGVPERSILQSYINHSSTLFKTYVLGPHVRVFTRSSLPNLPPHGTGKVEFDSQEEYPTSEMFGIEEEQIYEKPILEEKVYKDIAERIKKEFGISLFGFDVVVGEGGRVRVVDVNYFPSYKEMITEVPGLLRKFLEEKGGEGESLLV